MATVGQQLLAPEAGWRRLDDRDQNISYIGPSLQQGVDSRYYLSTYSQSIAINFTINFNFTGSSLRIIAPYGTDQSTSINIIIDNIVYNFNEHGSTTFQVLVFEILGLSNTEHHVAIINNTANYIVLDAIDINSTGYLRPYNEHPTQLICSKVSDMTVGDIIPCMYTATSGVAGTFSQLGTCVAAEIPYAGAVAPNGLFFFIKADTGKLIADRVLQTSISWDTLNAAKLIEEGTIVDIDLFPQVVSTVTTVLAQSSDLSVAASGSYAGNPVAGLMDKQDTSSSMWMSNIAAGTITITLNTPTKIDFLRIATKCGQNATISLYDSNNNLIIANNLSIPNSSYYSPPYIAMLPTNTTSLITKIVVYGANSNTGNNNFNINEISLESKVGSIRSLSGGCAYLGTDGKSSLTDKSLGAWPSTNEWDTYIANSNLNHKITAGDDKVWHTTTGTFTMDTQQLGVVNSSGQTCVTSTWRQLRYYNSGLNSMNPGITSNVWGSIGFRPVLEYIDNAKSTNLFY